MSGLIIKKFRERNNYSQKELAKILDVSVRTIARWEQNNTKPNSDELKRLATLLSVTEDEILSDTDINISSEQSNQDLIAKISDSVDNLVSGQETINESLTSNRDEYIKRQNELICELQNQNKQLLSKLDEQSKTIDSYKNALDLSKIELSHKRIRTIVIITTCLIVLIIIVGTWLYIWNHGLTDKEYIEGSYVAGEQVFFETND